MKPGHKHFLKAALICCMFAALGRAQSYVEDSIDVGGAWVGSLAYNSRQDVMYGASESGVFFAISCDSNKLIKSLPLGGAFAVTYDSIDNKAYCVYDDSLLVVDGSSHSRVKSLAIGGIPTVAVWDQASDRVYVSCQDANKVAVVDCVTDSVLKYISVGACPMKMYLNEPGRKLYVQDYDAGTVSVIDLTTDQVIKTLNVGGYPNVGYYCSGAGKFYSGGPVRQCVVISGQSDDIVARIPLSGNADVVSLTGNHNGTLVYLGTSDGGIDDYVATVSTVNDSVQATAVVDGGPEALACYWGSGLVYCATVRRGWVYVLSSDGALVLDSLQVGWSPFVFAQVPRHDRLYLGHLGSGFVYVLRDTSAGVLEWQPRSGFSDAIRVKPNPFTRSVTLVWNSATKLGDAVRVCAADGRLVREARMPKGQTRWVWDGLNSAGLPTPPGVYVLETGAGERAKVVKLRQ